MIVLVGDGMGMAQLDVASRFAHGEPGALAMQTLPHAGEVRTGGPSGITDSAAAATVMASGVYTFNGNIGVDRDAAPVASVLERAQAQGWAVGVVTTTSLQHATPAAFTAHVDSRAEYATIAEQQLTATRPDVMLGGGAQWIAPARLDELAGAGWAVVDTAAELDAAAASATQVLGVFAPDQMTFVADRAADTTEPMLADMARAALAVLDRDPDGFFLMIEGGRIDHGGHASDLVDVVQETLAFDATVAAVAEWARDRGNTTVLVTADHECGGLAPVAAAPAGTYPEVTWRWTQHTSARVAIFGDGPGTDVVDRTVIDHRWVHAIALARITGEAFVAPPRVIIPDGELADLRRRVAVQANETGFGAGYNQLDALWVDADAHGLAIGVEGVFEWGANAVEIWLDVDHGASTGPGGLASAITDASGAADAILAASTVRAPAAPGFGVDLVVVTAGGADPHVEDLADDAGLRGVRAPYGGAADLGWRRAAINFGAVRTRGAPLAAVPGQGLEVHVSWSELYGADAPPPGAMIALAAILVDETGGYTSNQALPPFAPGTANPGRAGVALPGVAVVSIDELLSE